MSAPTQMDHQIFGKEDDFVDITLNARNEYPMEEFYSPHKSPPTGMVPLPRERLQHFPCPAEVLAGVHKAPEEAIDAKMAGCLLLVEFSYLQNSCPPGMYVMPSTVKPRVWDGVLFVRGGWYENGIFNFRVDFPDGYPNEKPTIRFLDPVVFHPLVDPTDGQLDLSALGFPNSHSGSYNVASMLAVVRQMFYKRHFFVSSPESAGNPDAKRLFENDRVSFLQRVAECVESSQRTVEDPVKCVTEESPFYLMADRQWDSHSQAVANAVSHYASQTDVTRFDALKGLEMWVNHNYSAKSLSK